MCNSGNDVGTVRMTGRTGAWLPGIDKSGQICTFLITELCESRRPSCCKVTKSPACRATRFHAEARGRSEEQNVSSILGLAAKTARRNGVLRLNQPYK